MDCSTPGFLVHHKFLEPTQTHVHLVSDAVQRSHPLLPPSPPTFNLSQHQGLFQWVSSFYQVAKVLGFQLHHPSSEYSRWISFRIDWLSLLAVQGTLWESNTTVQKHQFFSTQLSLWSNSHIHIWLLEKTIPLTRWTFVGKVMSLLFNILSRFVIAFLPRSKHLLISWLQSPSAVVLEPPKIKSVTISPSICHEVMGPDAMILVFWMLSFKTTFSTLLFHFHQEAL